MLSIVSVRARDLPVFLADNHAETMGWITRQFDLEEPHVMVLIDAHSDANSIERSEEVRELLRRVASVEEREKRVEVWRSGGRIQAYNWIEPLLPRPLERVVWVPEISLSESRRLELERRAVDCLDDRLEVEPRSAGSFEGRWEARDFAALKSWQPGMRPVILALDLDFFAGKDDAAARFGELWELAMEWPGLAGVAIAVSRPWLTDDAEAERLVTMAVDAVRRTRGAALECDFTIDRRPDGSLKAEELTRKGGKIPRWDVAGSGLALRSLFAAELGRWKYEDRQRKVDAAFWNVPPAATIVVGSGSPDADGVWRVQAGAEPVLRLRPPPEVEATGKVRWFALKSAREAYDFLPETGLGKSFAEHPGRWIYMLRRDLGITTDFAFSPESWMKMLDNEHRCGRVLIEAEYETNLGWLPVGKIDLRVLVGEGFHAGLSECFGMPYAFGIAVQAECDKTGLDTGWGADCSNFLAHAWRRSGVSIDWGDPGYLRGQLDTVAVQVIPDSTVRLDPEMVRRGVMVDFGRHVAALWLDREPLGVLDGGDLMAHHLGGNPEVVRLDELARARGKFAVRTPRRLSSCRLAFAGDLVLAGESGDDLDDLSKSCGSSDCTMANLEGIPSNRNPDHAPVFDFRFSADRLLALRRAGIRVVSLANNHAADAGLLGIVEGRAALEQAGIGTVGAGENLAHAMQPWRTEVKGVKLAVFGVSLAQAPAAAAGHAGVVRLPEHSRELQAAFQAARNSGAVVVVLVHWGDEHVTEPNEDQREWARWFVRNGASVISGSGPHVVQKPDAFGGAVIQYSLGNAVYPSALRGRGSGCIWYPVIDSAGNMVSQSRQVVP